MTFWMLFGGMIGLVAAAVAVVSGGGIWAAMATLAIFWVPAALACGFRPMWDETFRAEGGRWSHTAWFFTQVFGLKGLAVLGLPVALTFFLLTLRGGTLGWAVLNGLVMLAAVAAIAWRPQRRDWQSAGIALALAAMLAVALPLGLLLLGAVGYVGPVAAAVYLLGVVVSWLSKESLDAKAIGRPAVGDPAGDVG